MAVLKMAPTATDYLLCLLYYMMRRSGSSTMLVCPTMLTIMLCESDYTIADRIVSKCDCDNPKSVGLRSMLDSLCVTGVVDWSLKIPGMYPLAIVNNRSHGYFNKVIRYRFSLEELNRVEKLALSVLEEEKVLVGK